MTLLTILQDVADEVGITRPSTIIANPDDDALKLLRMSKKIGQFLLRKHAWLDLRKEGTFTSVGTEVQTSMLPSDFDRFWPETIWNRTDNTLISQVRPVRWQSLKAADPGGRSVFIRRGDVISVYPTMTAGKTLAFEYVSVNWVDTNSDGIGDAATWAADANTPVFDEDLMTQGVIFEYLASNGLPARLAFQQFEDTMNALIHNEEATPSVLSAGDIFGGRHGTGEPGIGDPLSW